MAAVHSMGALWFGHSDQSSSTSRRSIPAYLWFLLGGLLLALAGSCLGATTYCHQRL